jgi:hypothetical protein
VVVMWVVIQSQVQLVIWANDDRAANVADRTLLPVNGLRHPPEGDTTGWYIWAGEEWSDAPDAFQALHVQHLPGWRPEVIPYLALPPGWRFLVAPGYEDVWYLTWLINRAGRSTTHPERGCRDHSVRIRRTCSRRAGFVAARLRRATDR